MATNIVLQNIRGSYVHIMEPYAAQPGQEAKYSMTILLPKTDTAGKAQLDAAIAAAVEQGKSQKWNGVAPVQVPHPVHDGDGLRANGEPFGDECKGHWVFTASSKLPIEVVNGQMQKILSPTEVYSGAYYNAAVNFYPYFFSGKKGIAAGLGPVQKVRDGESFGGSAPSASSVFSAVEAPADPF